MNKVLIHEHKDYIEGYGFLSDTRGETLYGVPIDKINKYTDIHTEFKEDKSLEKYKIGKIDPRWDEIPYIEIPRGILKIYGVKVDV